MGQSTSVAILVVVAFAVSCSAASVELFQRFPNLNPRQLSNATDVTACKPLASTFFENVHDSCQPFALALQTCPDTKISVDQLFNLSRGMSRCTLNAFHSSFPCAREQGAQLNMGPPLANPLSINSSQTCKDPNYLPIFQDASRYFMDHVDCCGQVDNGGLGAYNYSGEGESRTVYSSIPIVVIQQTPVQYQRCVFQKPPEKVHECVVDTISKLRWLSEGLFIWGGQSKQCSGVAPFFISTAFTIVADLLETAYQMWSYRKKGKEKHFSWATLWWQLVKGFGTPALQAYLFYRQSFSTSVFTLLQIFLLTPKIAPIIGFVSPFLIGKTWAVQLLTVDTLLAIASLYTPYVTIMNLLNTGSIQSQDTPSGMWIVSLGTLLTVIPGLGVALLYMASGVVMWAFFILGCIFKAGMPFRFGLTLLIFWLALIFFFVISPIFALWEIGWKTFAGKERKFEFPPLRWVEDAMGSTSWVVKFLKYFGYWFWCLVQLAVFVGRWMILANLLPLAGEAFCPSKAKEIATGSALFALGIAATSIGLSAAGLTY